MLLLRCDMVLLAPAVAALDWCAAGENARTWLRKALPLLGLGGGLAVVVFLLLRSWILGTSMAAAQRASTATVLQFWERTSWPHQLLPLVTALGPGVFLFALVGGALLLAGRSSRLRWLLAAPLPGLMFWCLITGNNTRHVIALELPLLWAGFAGWQRWAPRAVAPAALAAVALGWLAIPANSNPTLYPSPDVVVSHQLLVHRERQVDTMAGELEAEATEAGFQSCFLGSNATPYLLAHIVTAQPQPRRVSFSPDWQQVIWPAGHGQSLVGAVYSASAFAAALARCPQPLSVDYNARDATTWYFGSELDSASMVTLARSWMEQRDLRAAAR